VNSRGPHRAVLSPRPLRGAAAILATLLLVAGATPLVRAADQPLGQRYVALLRAARDALPADPPVARRDLDEAAGLAGSTAGVGPALEALTAGDPQRARHLLDNEVAALALPDDAEPGDDAQVGQRLDDVYAQPSLDQLDRTRPHSVFDDIGSLLRRFFSGLGDGFGLGRDAALLIGLLAGTALVILAVTLLRRITAGPWAAVPAEPRQPGDDPAAEWAAAEAAAAAGDHREAVRRAFRSALLSVARQGRLPIDAAWTTRELLSRSAGDADLVALLAPAAAAFDVAWYSGRPVTEADWEAARRRCQAIRAMAEGRAVVPRR